MADFRTDLETQIRHALEVGEISPALERHLAQSANSCATDRERKLLLLLQDAVQSGHVQRLCPRERIWPGQRSR
ncbi:MAG: hypothetical protein ACFB4J_07930 [Elainellaceae cyanobacterium]